MRDLRYKIVPHALHMSSADLSHGRHLQRYSPRRRRSTLELVIFPVVQCLEAAKFSRTPLESTTARRRGDALAGSVEVCPLRATAGDASFRALPTMAVTYGHPDQLVGKFVVSSLPAFPIERWYFGHAPALSSNLGASTMMLITFPFVAPM